MGSARANRTFGLSTRAWEGVIYVAEREHIWRIVQVVCYEHMTMIESVNCMWLIIGRSGTEWKRLGLTGISHFSIFCNRLDLILQIHVLALFEKRMAFVMLYCCVRNR